MSNTTDSTLHLTDLTNDQVFERIFRMYFAALVGFAQKYTNDHEVAKELVQEVFLNIWSTADKIKINTNIKSYLYGAVRNAALNYLKHQKVKKKYIDHQLYTQVNEEFTDFIELDELKEKMEMALDKIPEKCRQIFELNRFEGKRYKEIATELGLSLKTVENQMGRALKILRTELGEYLPLVLWFLCIHGGKM